MENKRIVQISGALFCVLLIVSGICCYPPQHLPEDYEQGIEDIAEDLEGLIGHIYQRAYLEGPKVMRRSSNLRLRFGKRGGSQPLNFGFGEHPVNPNWKVNGNGNMKE